MIERGAAGRGWALAWLCATGIGAIALGRTGDVGSVLWLHACWSAGVALLVVRVWLRRDRPALRLADLVLNVCAMLLLGQIGLTMVGGVPAAPSPAAEVALALAFAVALTGVVVRLGLLLDGRSAMIQLIDA